VPVTAIAATIPIAITIATVLSGGLRRKRKRSRESGRSKHGRDKAFNSEVSFLLPLNVRRSKEGPSLLGDCVWV
jgi:hypothetical protein